MAVHSMWKPYPELANELNSVKKLIDQSIQMRNKEVEAVLKDVFNRGGKMLRPAYTLLFSTFGPDHDIKRARAIAASVELLHTATLIHDDIIDDSPLRRGQETIQSRYGKDAAVYAGDYLFTVSFRLLAQYAQSNRQLEINTKGMERILMGELDQMHLYYNLRMTMRQYLTQISGKTAQLFALSCYAGSIEGGLSEKESRKGYYIGSDIGMAFQLLDDILDYTQTSETFGKPVLEDVRQGIYTAPLIFAMQKNRSLFLPLLEKQKQMTDQDMRKVQRLVIEFGGVEEAQLLAQKYTDKAMKRIKALPETNEKMILSEITTQLLERRQ
ncbi:polyprenyl synthetase family protein [Marinilactibacillus kalidii]|uniref:polyprenyl synthetase family protein n=1 Tax=Marinilactibacillus kalidii TaxID=2820274 RepID=UPI001ABDA0BC|nr:polyprenyl synthetase family protein [Marinilactibacillus kalidii]